MPQVVVVWPLRNMLARDVGSMDITSLVPFGSTRSRVAQNYALITPDTHVRSPLVGWRNASAVVHISPQLGARFLQYTATLEAVAVQGQGKRPSVGSLRWAKIGSRFDARHTPITVPNAAPTASASSEPSCVDRAAGPRGDP